MTEPNNDPPRILSRESDASAKLRSLLQAARHDDPSSQQLGTLRQRMSGPLSTAPGTIVTTGWASKLFSAALHGKSLAAILVVAIASGVGAWTITHVRTFGVRASVAPRVIVSARTDHPTDLVTAAAPIASALVEDRDASREAQTVPRAESSPVVVTHSQARVAVARTASTDGGEDNFRIEAEILGRARDAIARHAATEALAAVSDHQARFANGVLVEERERLAVEALLINGQHSAAEARAARFAIRFPQSPYRRRIAALFQQIERDQ